MVPSSILHCRWLPQLLCLCGALALAGCGKPGVAKLYPVKGKVTRAGKPVTSGMVVFEPQETEKSKSGEFMITGAIGADGSYEIKTGEKSGAPLGKYKATVNQGMPMSMEEAAKMSKMGPPPGGPSGGPDSSTVEVEVVASPKPGAYDLKLRK